MNKPLQELKLKITHITFDMRIGGTEMVIKNLIEGSDSNLFEMSIFCIEEPLGPWGIDLQKSGIPITSKARKSGFDTSLISAIRQHIKTNNIDIIHCHQYTPWVYGVLAALGTKTKVIFTEHGRFYPDTSSWKRKLINPWLAKITDGITAISQATKQALIDFENIKESAIQVVYNGIFGVAVDPTVRDELAIKLAIPDGTLCLGTIARLDPIKNHTMMLKAFKRVLDAGIKCKLLIVGDGEQMPVLLTLIDELNIKDQVILTGYEPSPQNHLALMDIFLLPSLSEGTSMTLLEAMSIGKPCIVTHAGGNPEIVLHQVTGIVTPNNDETAFVKAIVELANNFKLQEQFSRAAKLRFEQGFSIPNMAKAYQSIYLNTLPKSNGLKIQNNG
ncbi:glycosyltransferase [Paraglaciecola aestuariivivens]